MAAVLWVNCMYVCDEKESLCSLLVQYGYHLETLSITSDLVKHVAHSGIARSTFASTAPKTQITPSEREDMYKAVLQHCHGCTCITNAGFVHVTRNLDSKGY